MVSVGAWQWQYWLRYGCLFAGVHFIFEKLSSTRRGCDEWDCRVGSGSGWVQLVPLDRGDQGGSNGVSYNVAVAVLA
jgi:hypothetical protein